MQRRKIFRRECLCGVGIVLCGWFGGCAGDLGGIPGHFLVCTSDFVNCADGFGSCAGEAENFWFVLCIVRAIGEIPARFVSCTDERASSLLSYP